MEEETIKASIMDTDDEHAFDQIKALVLPKNKSAMVSTKNAYASPNVGKNCGGNWFGTKALKC